MDWTSSGISNSYEFEVLDRGLNHAGWLDGVTGGTVTQTYRATFTLDAPKDVDILPGMTCTVSAKIPEEEMEEVAKGSLSVPFSAVGAAADTRSFVWRLDAQGDGTYAVHRAFVKLGARTGESILIESGLSAGDRVAVAGVTVLTEGRVVRLIDESAAK